MIVRTEVKPLSDDRIMTIQYDENDVPVKFCAESKTGARVRCEIMNPERWHQMIDNLYEHYKLKMQMQSDEQMKVYEDYTVRKHAQLAEQRAKKSTI